MSRYDRLLVSFYIVSGLCFVSTLASFYFLRTLDKKINTYHFALETMTYQFKVCKRIYRKGLTKP